MNEYRYIIKNCPAWQPHEVHYCYNSGNTRICPVYKDCILKQIVELCKEESSIIQHKQKVKVKGLNKLADRILELLDIHKVET